MEVPSKINNSGESNIELEFAESATMRDIFGQMEDLNTLYTVQINPRTDKDSFEVFGFDKKIESNNFLHKISIKVFK